MKILAIGNSFSQDATRYLQKITESAGESLYVRNLYIGGCSLERHAQNVKSGEEAYDYEENAEAIGKISVTKALSLEKWDVVTVQQVSHFSGKLESYEPFLTELIDHIKANAPQAKIVFHRTWPYEKGSSHGGFLDYGCDRSAMYERIVDASTVAAKSHGLEIIGTGDTVYTVGETSSFNTEKGGISLYRDGFHLGLIYGRYLAALTWFKHFTKKPADSVTYIPDGADETLIKQLKKEADLL